MSESDQQEIDFFNINTPSDLLTLIEQTYADYHRQCKEKDLMFLIFAFNHLGEWITEGKKYREVERIDEQERTDAQKFAMQVWSTSEHRTVNQLANRSKHFLRSSEQGTSIAEGAVVGYMRAGDSMGRDHHLVDGQDIRCSFDELKKWYSGWINDQRFIQED